MTADIFGSYNDINASNREFPTGAYDNCVGIYPEFAFAVFKLSPAVCRPCGKFNFRMTFVLKGKLM